MPTKEASTGKVYLTYVDQWLDTLPAAINSPADPNPCFIPIRLEPQATHLSSPSVIQTPILTTSPE